MTDADYRAMASEIRDLVPLLLHAQAVADLRLLADRYERLAHYLELAAVQSLASIKSPSSAGPKQSFTIAEADIRA